jgi:ABC-type dipeptide/oligopeptide/nickel transport system ATPase subunit
LLITKLVVALLILQGEAEGNPREYVKDGVLLRECSGGQKHLIYVLRELAAERPVLLLDELLCGLDTERQARVLAMLRERKSRTAMLYITTDLHSLSVMCSAKTDQVLYMDEGVIVERCDSSYLQ